MNGREIPDRVFYRIKEVCTLTGLKPHVLRYWEQEFKDIKPVKSPTGQRLYKKKDLEIIFTIKKLLHEKRFTIDGAKQYLANHKRILNEIREELTELVDNAETRGERKEMRNIIVAFVVGRPRIFLYTGTRLLCQE